MSGKDFVEQLTSVRPYIGRSKTEQDPIVETNLQEGTAMISTPAISTKIVLTEADQKKFIEGAHALQQATIREKKVSTWMAGAAALLTIVAAAGAGYSAYKGSRGTGGVR